MVTVIIPTSCTKNRGNKLLRSVNSVLNQEGVSVELIVVVNGKKYDEQLFYELKKNKNLMVLYREKASLPSAIREGRKHVEGRFFSFLDDDDEYLDGALELRVGYLQTNAKIDYVVTNGYKYVIGGGKKRYVDSFEGIEEDPIKSLLKNNWMASCGGTFRSSTIDINFFDGETKYFEWTMTAFRLGIAQKKVRFLDVPTFVVHETPDSLSKSTEYFMGNIEAINKMIELSTDPKVKKMLKKKKINKLHSLSYYYLQRGLIRQSWNYHLESVRSVYGLKYLPYTRHLISLKL